ncbi:radical SAM domain-containing protein [Helicobacter cinaedi CCUG 18818 = ATCC BAA-847]|uniref:Radical SAM domain protein n=1 Tax=Helicobacter cinaedi CCUG 18818 = ATCC BAA-847 TaxID=537971 RepID=A0AAI8MPQ7_9HELI|nr:radical SAM/SPASM domain-containing protein [Helicobacter cinaedi]EFR46146.1 radical SAM domain protein [Helicobacter cinaedi CCUG 18818 = ATCC BAA-847]BAM33504.1 radical SAM domain-containing protein [Helicobacter cinaedi CCUG 18818 = ATCC BAA-847]
MLKRAIRYAYKKVPNRLKSKLYNLMDTDSFYTNKIQNLIDSITMLSTPITDRESQKRILKQFLQAVEIEIASFCNRTCYFCPNSHIDRKSKSIELDEVVFLKLIDNLSEIDYDKFLNFHRFNEPLANRELILKRVRQARQKLPKAKFCIFTNGDYAEKAYFEELREAGVTHILMSYYPTNKDYDREKIIKAMEKMQQKLSLESKLMYNTLEEYRVCFMMEGLEIEYRSWNPNVTGQSRGGSLDFMKQKRDIQSGCFQSAMSFYVDYNGLVMPCCHTRSDEETHKPFILGDCNKNDMFEIFFSTTSTNLRKELFANTAKTCNKNIQKICQDCTDRRREMFFQASNS